MPYDSEIKKENERTDTNQDRLRAIMDQQDQMRLQLHQERSEYQAQQAAEEDKGASPAKRMGWGVLVLGIILTLIQLGVSWLADLTAATGVGLVVSVLCWIGGGLISLVLYFLLKPYRESIKEIKLWVNMSLVLNAVPLIDSIPFDLIGISYAFVKSRSHIVQKLASYAERSGHMIPHLPNNSDKGA